MTGPTGGMPPVNPKTAQPGQNDPAAKPDGKQPAQQPGKAFEVNPQTAAQASKVNAPAEARKPTATAKAEAVNKTNDVSKVDRTERKDRTKGVQKTAEKDSAGASTDQKGKLNPFKRMEQLSAEYEKFMSESKDMEPTKRLEKLFWFQTQVQHAAFDVQIVSKVVEHATSGTRTLLQTQA